MLSKPSKKGPSQSLCVGRSSSREYQTDPEKQAENSVFEFFNRIGRKRKSSTYGGNLIRFCLGSGGGADSIYHPV
ncbi:MAG: hypothetical protein WAJ82_07990, partial [Azonexus sp.]